MNAEKDSNARQEASMSAGEKNRVDSERVHEDKAAIAAAQKVTITIQDKSAYSLAKVCMSIYVCTYVRTYLMDGVPTSHLKGVYTTLNIISIKHSR